MVGESAEDQKSLSSVIFYFKHSFIFFIFLVWVVALQGHQEWVLLVLILFPLDSLSGSLIMDGGCTGFFSLSFSTHNSVFRKQSEVTSRHLALVLKVLCMGVLKKDRQGEREGEGEGA